MSPIARIAEWDGKGAPMGPGVRADLADPGVLAVLAVLGDPVVGPGGPGVLGDLGVLGVLWEEWSSPMFPAISSGRAKS